MLAVTMLDDSLAIVNRANIQCILTNPAEPGSIIHFTHGTVASIKVKEPVEWIRNRLALKLADLPP